MYPIPSFNLLRKSVKFYCTNMLEFSMQIVYRLLYTHSYLSMLLVGFLSSSIYLENVCIFDERNLSYHGK
jgi:hypothetical protein